MAGDGRYDDAGSRVAMGVFLIGFGVALLARQLGLWSSVDLRTGWPTVFVIIAAAELVSPGRRRRAGHIVLMLMLAAIFFMHSTDVLHLRDSWPLLVVAGGVSMLFPRNDAWAGQVRRITEAADALTAKADAIARKFEDSDHAR